MAIETKLLFFLFSFFFVSSCLVSASVENRDPQKESQKQYEMCLSLCQRKQGQEIQQCKDLCEKRYKEQQHGFIVLNTEEDSHDPARKYQECQQECHAEHGPLRQSCLTRCDQEYKHDEIVDDIQTRDPERELQECQQQCTQQQEGQQQQQCKQSCVKRYQEQQGEGSGDDLLHTRETQDPEQEHQQCQQECGQQQQGQQQKQQCQQRCQCLYDCQKQRQGQQDQQSYCHESCRRQFEEQQGQRGGRQGDNDEESQWGQQEQGYQGESGGQQGDNENPYLFRQGRFQTKIRSQEGNVRVLERFNSRSNLLKGIRNYRISVYEASPNTFMTPNHWDANSVCIVLNGRGAITLLTENNKETHNLEQGDIYRIQAGVTAYSMNRDNNEQLLIAELTIPVNTPGEFETFHPVGGQDQQSYFSAFSDDILQSAFNVQSDQVRRMFEGKKGVFVKASQQQIRAMSQGSSGQVPWPFGHGSQSQYTYNLLRQRPSQSSRYGQLYEASPNEFRQLQDLDVAVSFANISQGAMLGPFYNSRSTKIAMIVRGDGYFEMACPHMSQQQGEQGQQQQGQQGQQRGSGSSSYHKVRARVSRGDVYVVPAGHPVVTVASNNQNLQVVCFDINAQNNQKMPLAGNNNILKQLEREAKELSFNIPVRQAEQILNKRQESWFFPGPQQQGGQVSA